MPNTHRAGVLGCAMWVMFVGMYCYQLVRRWAISEHMTLTTQDFRLIKPLLPDLQDDYGLDVVLWL
jgi:hypothetical protein